MLKKIDVPPYVVKELTLGEFLPMMKLIGENSSEGQSELMKRSVTLNNEPLGEKLNDIGASQFMPLWKAVAEVHGLTEPEVETKNG